MAVLLQWRQTWDGSLLNWTEVWGEGSQGAFSFTATAASTAFSGAETIGVAFNFSATAVVGFPNSTFSSAAYNLPGSTSVLWEGTQLAQPSALSVTASVSLDFLSNVGSAFDIHDDQTAMEPSAGSIVNATVIAVSSAVPVWVGSNAQDFAGFSIAATASLTPVATPFAGAELSATGTSAVTFAATPFYGTEFLSPSAVTNTWAAITLNPRGPSFAGVANVIFGPYSRAEGAFNATTTGFVEFGQTAGALSEGAFSVPASGSLAFTGDSKAIGTVDIQTRLSGEFAQPGGGVEFGALVLTHQLSLDFGAESIAAGSFLTTPHLHFEFSSTEFIEVDDDLKADADPRAIWQAAAQQEAWERDRRKLRKIARIDEDDLLTLSAALSQAISQATSSGVAAR